MSQILKSPLGYRPPQTENVIEFLRDNLKSNGDEILIVDGLQGRRWNGKQISLAISRVAQLLINECGIKKGDVVSLFGRSNDHMAITILSVIAVGATYKLVEGSVKDLARTAKVAHSKCVIGRSEKIPDIMVELKDHVRVIVAMDGPIEGCKSLEKQLDLNSTSCGVSLDKLVEAIPINVDKDIASIQFSSGTTGTPKRIPRTHKNLCHLVASVDHPELMDLKPGAIFGGFLPMGYRPGIWALLACIKGGASMVIDKYQLIDDVVEAIERYRMTIFSMSAIIMAKFSHVVEDSAKNHDMSCLKEIITTGAKIADPTRADLVCKTLKLDSLRQCFGMTEAGWCNLVEKSLAKDNYDTIGHAVPGMEMAIRDIETGNLLGPMEDGEVVLRGPQVFPGYLTDIDGQYNRADFTEDGWFRNGDQGHYTKDGLFYISGRYKELLTLSNNKKFWPDQVELAICKHPSVEAACVIKGPRPEDNTYDTARAFVILKKGCHITDAELFQFLEKETPFILIEAGIRFIEAFPRLANGKIDKQKLNSI